MIAWWWMIIVGIVWVPVGIIVGGWFASAGIADERTYYIHIIDNLRSRLLGEARQ